VRFLQIIAIAWLALTCVLASARAEKPLSVDEERALKLKDTFRECEDCPEMVVVPAGAFTMGAPASEKGRAGDEGPQRVVTIGKAFAAGKLHVTVDQFAAFVNETGYKASTLCVRWNALGSMNGSWDSPGFAQEGSHPAVCVTWHDAKAYADWLARKTGKPYRLLSEAEWEYAAHGRTQPGAYPRFWFGNDERDLCRYGNVADRKARDSIAWQWTADCYHDSYDGAPADGSARTAGKCDSGRVVRGGS
jgi:formylglycine-generating enzyme required for sulfatase activity